MNASLWQPSASMSVLKKRANFLAAIRSFFQKREYVEVETPVMAHFGVTDVYLSNIKARFRDQTYCLQTSPEYHMKRLLAAGSGPIFQLARVFRDDELGRWHNPEFTLLEWYQLGIDHEQLMNEVDDLLQVLLGTAPMVRKTYRDCFETVCDVDPVSASVSELKTILAHFDLDKVIPSDEMDKDQYLFLLMSHVIEPALSQEQTPVAVYGFPPSQASLAQIKNGVASRFEVYFKGVELANGFHELTDVRAQRDRFQADLVAREQKGLPRVALDEYLLEALECGLPACSGVALGVDRLFALSLGLNDIAQVLSFDVSRA